jgi:type IV pilus assembly protein PilQ
MPDSAVSADQQEAKKLAGIESVVPTGEGPATELLIKLTAPATFTSYKTTSPLRLVIDLSQVMQGNITAPVIINQGNFKTVTANRFDTDAGVLTRVEIELDSDSEALITSSPSNPGELRVSFPTSTESASSTVKNGPVEKSPVIAESPQTAPVSVPTAENESSVRTLTAILVNNNTVTLALDGAISEFKTFRLNKPERYVVDLMNVKSGLPSRLLPLNASGVASARIGIYPDKVRVVLDAVNGTFPEATSVKTDAGVIITLDVKSDDENANAKMDISDKADTQSGVQQERKSVVDSSVLPGVEPDTSKQDVQSKHALKSTNKPKAAPGPSSVEMIDFQVVNGISRVSVKVNGEVYAEQPVKTPGYVTLTIKDSILPKNLQRSLETRSFVSPVLRITPLSVKTKKSVDTKIRMAVRVAAPFEFRQEGDMLYIDFKHPEGLAGDKLFIDAIDQKKMPEQQKPAPAPDEEVSADLSPVLGSTSKTSGTTRSYKGRKVTLEFADAEVRKIFQLLSEVSNKNFVLGDDVTGAISLKLVNVPWDQALDIILDTKGLDKREDGNIILIKGKGKFRSQAEEELEIRRTAAKAIELKTETFSVNYADLAAITSQFEKLKTPDRGQIASDVRTSKVIVKDTPQALNDMRDLLNQLDLPEKQVMIEARIVEATSTFSRNLGVNWGVHSRDGSASFLGINSFDSVFGGIASSPPTTGTGTTSGGSMGISFGTLASTVKLDMRLSAAASAGLIKIISSPKVATLNNKAAKISQGQSIPYTSSTSDKIETKFVSATLSLEVTPHINANGTIIMKIDAKNDFPGTGTPPPINTKQATTELLLKDGETTVIGGIFVDSEQEGDDGVPFLMDIPFLGHLFKSNTKSITKTELLIFITPRILGQL